MSKPAPLAGARGPLRVLLACLSLSLTLGVVEAAVRIFHPALERTQLLQATDDLVLEDLDGTPVWHSRRKSPGRWQLDCARQRPGGSIVAFGSSILAGVGIEQDQVWSTRLQQDLDAQPPAGGASPCVHNLAETGFGHDQKAAVARERLAGLHPAVVLWEVWGTDTARYVWVGDAALRVGSLQVDSLGLPNPMHLPPVANRWLLGHSHVWRIASVRATPEVQYGGHGHGVAELYGQEMPRLADLVRSLGAQLVLVTAPPLFRSFEASVADPSQLDLQARALADSHEQVHLVSLAQELRHDDVEALRMDTCCHYNVAGNARLAQVLERALRPLLDDSAQPDTVGD